MSQCCVWRADLRAEKELVLPLPEQVGDAVVFRVRWYNDGPDRAVSPRIRDFTDLPQVIGLDPDAVVDLSYTAGATGPATTTLGDLASQDGVVLDRMEAGSYVEALVSGTWQAGFDGATVRNTAQIIPAPGHEDPNPFNNTSSAAVLSPLCALRCDTDFGYVANIGGLTSGGICVGVENIVLTETHPGLADYRAIFRGRTQSMIQGAAGIFSGVPGGFHLQEDVTNPWDVPALLSVDLVVQPNALVNQPGVGRPLDVPPVTFVHTVGTELAVNPPSFGAASNPVPLNWCYTTINSSSPVFDVLPGATGPAGYTPQTNSCRFQRVLDPGETITLYAQWFALWGGTAANRIPAGYQYVLHGGMASVSRLDRGFVEA